jgi:hypothetical protein
MGNSLFQWPRSIAILTLPEGMSIVQVIQSNQILPIDRRANGAAPPVEKKNKKSPLHNVITRQK